jgi:protein ImuB
LVRDTGRQLRLWGDAVVSDRVARAAIRVQAMLGHGAVTRPVPAGGRRPSDQMLLVPFGDTGVPPRPADRPWPGQIPAPAPATVYPAPRPAWVTDSAGTAVSVTARAQLSAPPAWLSAPGQPTRAITSWAGPWPVSENWWDPARARRQARFQLVTDDGGAWLAVLQDGCWLIEASYD